MAAAVTERRRKAIPDRVKLKAALKRFGLRVEEVQFDHFPALGLREWDPVAKDTIPPANDPEFIQMLFLDEHRTKTSGRRGEKRSTSYGSDAHAIAKVRRNEKANAEFMRTVSTKGEREKTATAKPKRAWPKQTFRKRTSR